MKNTFCIYFYIRRNSLNKQGKAAIMARVTVDGSMTQFSTKATILPQLWDTKNCRAKGRSEEARTLNQTIDKISSSISTHFHKLTQTGDLITPEKLRNAFFNKDETALTLLSVFSDFRENKRQLLGIKVTPSTFRKYDLTYRRLEDFMKAKYKFTDVGLREIKPVFIQDFANYLMCDCKLNNNSAIKLIQILKQVILLAINNGWLSSNPFAYYKLSLQKTDRGYLRKDELERILNKSFSIPRLEQVRDLFLFACFTGLSYIDIRYLRKEHICPHFDGNTWIIAKRQKTNTDIRVRLFDVPQQILRKYENTNTGNYLLPVISHQKVNSYLKEIADLCKIDKNLTFHLARHTFATTVTLANGVPIETVSKMLGHTNIKTTLIYARITDEKVSKDMEALNDKISELSIQYKNC